MVEVDGATLGVLIPVRAALGTLVRPVSSLLAIIRLQTQAQIMQAQKAEV